VEMVGISWPHIDLDLSAIRSAQSVSLLFVSFASLWRLEGPERDFYIFLSLHNFDFFMFLELARLSAASSMYGFKLFILSLVLQEQASCYLLGLVLFRKCAYIPFLMAVLRLKA